MPMQEVIERTCERRDGLRCERPGQAARGVDRISVAAELVGMGVRVQVLVTPVLRGLSDPPTRRPRWADALLNAGERVLGVAMVDGGFGATRMPPGVAASATGVADHRRAEVSRYHASRRSLIDRSPPLGRLDRRGPRHTRRRSHHRVGSRPCSLPFLTAASVPEGSPVGWAGSPGHGGAPRPTARASACAADP